VDDGPFVVEGRELDGPSNLDPLDDRVNQDIPGPLRIPPVERTFDQEPSA
jgi:hypothetical protein